MAGIDTDFTLSNRYRLLRRVRVGTAGDVWEARDLRAANRLIDIEIFSDDPLGDPGFVERRRRGIEWLLWPWFLHPSAPRILQYGEEEAIRFVVLEHLEGETLAERLGHGAAMKPADAARRAAEIAEAIQKAHETGFVHGELRTENILITREGATKVLELGFTPAAWEGGTLPDSENQQGADRERPQEAGLKPEANEEARLRDLYALGVVLYQMLTGHPPAPPSEVGGGEDDPLPVELFAPWVPRDLAEVCEAAVSTDPRVRPPTAAALASVLRAHAAAPLAPLAPSGNAGGDPERIVVVEEAAAPSVKIREEEIVRTLRESRGNVRSAAKAARRSAHAERALQKERARADRAAQDEAAKAHKAREREEQAMREAEERRVREETARREAEERARVEAERLAAEEAQRLEAERLAAEERAGVEAEERARRGAEEQARREAEQASRLEAERRAAEEAARLQAEERAWQKAVERARLEAARLAAEAGEAVHHEDRRVEAELRAVAIGAAEPMPARAARKELRRKAKQVAKADRKAKKELRRRAKQ